MTEEEIRAIVREELCIMHSSAAPANQTPSTTRYTEARKKYQEAFKQLTPHPYYAYKIADAIREVCRHDNGVRQIKDFTPHQAERAGELYERMGACYLQWLEENTKED